MVSCSKCRHLEGWSTEWEDRQGYTSFQDVLSKDFLGVFCGKCCQPFACARIMEPCPAHKAQDPAGLFGDCLKLRGTPARRCGQ